MIIALDIETIPNTTMIPLLPEPKISKTLKDPAKIEAAQASAKQEQIDKMALDALTARVACYSVVGLVNPMSDGEQEHVEIIPEISDAAETVIIQSIMRMLGSEDVRIVTWNGIGFDLPMIYKRAMVLGIDPANFDAPPLTSWTKRYNTDRHFDLMQIWGGWSSAGFTKLDTVSRMVLGDNKTEDFDVTAIAGMLSTAEGRDKVSRYCLQDTRLTWELWKRFNGTLFA